MPPIHFPDTTSATSPSSIVLPAPVYQGEKGHPALKSKASFITPSETHSNYQTPARRCMISDLVQRHNSSARATQAESLMDVQTNIHMGVAPSSPPTRSLHISVSTHDYISKLLQRKQGRNGNGNGNENNILSREEMVRQSKRYKNRISVQKCRRRSRERQIRLENERKTLRRENTFLQQLKVLVERSGVLSLVPKNAPGEESGPELPRAMNANEGDGLLITSLTSLT